MLTLTQNDLKDMRCQKPGCTCGGTQVYFVPACHPKADVAACYDSKTGELTLECGECTKPVANLLVAAGKH